jgi:hypothetical protein
MRFISIIAAVSAACALSTAAAAAIVTVTYTGTVSSGFDQGGIFGAADADLNGLPYAATYKFDTTKGSTSNSDVGNGLAGGTDVGQESPSLGTFITINGASAYIDGLTGAYIYGYNDGTLSYQYHADLFTRRTSDPASNTYKYTESYIVNESFSYGDLPSTIDKAFSMDTVGNFYNYGYFFTRTYECIRAIPIPLCTRVEYTYATLTPTHITETVAGVPELGRWALMSLGLAGLGATLRAKRRCHLRAGELKAAVA